METLEIVRPDALKRLISSVNGSTYRISSVDLARMKLNWPKNSIRPPHPLIYSCAIELHDILNNPPDGFEAEEIQGKYLCIELRRERK